MPNVNDTQRKGRHTLSSHHKATPFKLSNPETIIKQIDEVQTLPGSDYLEAWCVVPDKSECEQVNCFSLERVEPPKKWMVLLKTDKQDGTDIKVVATLSLTPNYMAFDLSSLQAHICDTNSQQESNGIRFIFKSAESLMEFISFIRNYSNISANVVDFNEIDHTNNGKRKSEILTIDCEGDEIEEPKPSKPKLSTEQLNNTTSPTLTQQNIPLSNSTPQPSIELISPPSIDHITRLPRFQGMSNSSWLAFESWPSTTSSSQTNGFNEISTFSSNLLSTVPTMDTPIELLAVRNVISKLLLGDEPPPYEEK